MTSFTEQEPEAKLSLG